jgi:endonuclease-3 related protein
MAAAKDADLGAALKRREHFVPLTEVTASHAQNQLRQYYETLYRSFGPQNWWPARSRIEVIAAAFLTQNTAWANVEKAIENLRRAGVMSVEGLRGVPLAKLERLVHPSGYFRQKARRLKTFIHFLDHRYGGSLLRMFRQPTMKLRDELLALNGIGPETADSILLYAGGHPIFVVDAYTRRILERHGIISGNAPYDEIRKLFETALDDLTEVPASAARDPRHPPSRMSRARRSALAQHYNDLHGLIVRIGNEFCRANPKCEQCPLREFLPS